VPHVNSFRIAALHVRKHTGQLTKKHVNEEQLSYETRYCSSNPTAAIWGIVRFVFYHYQSLKKNTFSKYAAVRVSAMDVTGRTDFLIGMIPTTIRGTHVHSADRLRHGKVLTREMFIDNEE
jgi:hypothetical protein